MNIIINVVKQVAKLSIALLLTRRMNDKPRTVHK